MSSRQGKFGTQSMLREHICVMGASLGTSNRGVSALASSICKLLKHSSPCAELVMLIGNENDKPFELREPTGCSTKITVVNYRLHPLAKPTENLFVIFVLAAIYKVCPIYAIRSLILSICPWIRFTASAKFVGDIRGGDSFSDIYGLLNFLISSLPVISVILVRGNIVQFPQTFGPFRHLISRKIAKYILSNSSRIMSRDAAGEGVVRALIGNDAKVYFCPDVAFLLDPIPPPKWPIGIADFSSQGSVIVGINVNGLMFNGGYSRKNMFGLRLDYPKFLRELITALVEYARVRVLLVPHTYAPPGGVESDPEACDALWESLPSAICANVTKVKGEFDQHELKAIIGNCDFFVGSRMHSCIAALSQGVPTVGVAYSDKFAGVFESVGMKDWVIDGRTHSENAAVDRCIELFEMRTVVSDSLAASAGAAKLSLRDAFTFLA